MKATVNYLAESVFATNIRGHKIVIDLPPEKSGKDTGPTPPEYFIASLGSCIGMYVLGFCKNSGFNPEGLHIDVDWEMEKNPMRIGNIDVKIHLPKADVGNKEKALLKVASNCVVHETIKGQPPIKVSLG